MEKSKHNKHSRKLDFMFPTKFMSKILTWLGKLMKISFTEVMLSQKVLDKIARVYNTRGKTECIKYSKQLRADIISYISTGDRNYLPKTLLPLKKYMRGENISYPVIRLALTATYSTRFIRLKPTPSLITIEARPGYTGNPTSLSNLAKEFLSKGLGVNPKHFGKVPKAIKFKEFHMTSKSGPNGHALWSSYLDAIQLKGSLLESIKILGGDKLVDLIHRFSSLYQRIPQFFEAYSPHGGDSLRKITVISDKEGKSREVAILDYYSQSALRPLHNYLFKALSRIHQDCTHDQTKLTGLLTPRKGSKFHSIDLTSATDRFPLAVEKLILSIWFGEKFADAWSAVMVGLPFKIKDREIVYGTGNPMGAYSSWATFALAHHFFVFIACKRARRNWKKCPYMLLGDDIVIADDRVAQEYKRLLSEWDIPFSPEKTHSSSKFYEFAKQLYLDGQNVSPFPLAALYERRNSLIESMGIIARELTFKDWNSDIWASLKSYLSLVNGYNRKHIRNIFPKLRLAISLMFYLQGQGELGTAIKEYVASSTGQVCKWVPMTEAAYCQYVAADVVTELFTDARDRVTSGNQPLGELSTLMVMAITSLRDGGADCFDLIESVPFLQIYGRAEETFLRISKPTIGARLIRDGREMRSALEVVDIPLSDRDFYVRHRDVIVIKALKASKKIVKILKDHMERNPRFHKNPVSPLMMRNAA